MSTGLGRAQAQLGSEIKQIDSNASSPQLDRTDSEDENQTFTTSTVTSTTSRGRLNGHNNSHSQPHTTEFTHLGAQGEYSQSIVEIQRRVDWSSTW